MTFVCIHSRSLDGFESPPVSVEVDLSLGTGGWALVGLPEVEVRESKDRVRSAIINSQFEFPIGNLTVNLAPADLPKESGRFDLPIALGILAAAGNIPIQSLEGYEFAGELSLSGGLRPIRGALAMAWRTMSADRTFILPEENAKEAALVTGARVIGAKSLLEITAHLRGLSPLPLIQQPASAPNATPAWYPDMHDVKGQAQAKRILLITAAGGHNLLMIGPPGTGKSMLAQRLPGIMPTMTNTQALETAALQSLTQGVINTDSFGQRPFRAPHHTASSAAMVGGGTNPRPGEISLSHHGVLFLDELPEFDRRVLEVLREPIESGRIIISRAQRKVEFPARFQLVGAMNPCPCGYYGHATHHCRCTPMQIDQYVRKISGPLLDRIDLTIEVPSLSSQDLQKMEVNPEDSSQRLRSRVEQAFLRQIERQDKPNAQLSSAQLDKVCALDSSGKTLIAKAMDKLGLSARAYYRILKVARTIADLEQTERVATAHISEAIQYRRSRLLRSS